MFELGRGRAYNSSATNESITLALKRKVHQHLHESFWV